MNNTTTPLTLDRIADCLDAILSLLRHAGPPAPEREQKTFDEFAQYYFDNFRWRKVSADTKRTDLCRYNTHILPALGAMPLDAITPADVQALIDGLDPLHKTQQEVFSLVNIVMKYAIKHRYIEHNPCDVIYIEPYEKEHGRALSKDEELKLLSESAGTPYQIMFAVALYAGLRPCEYRSARIDGAFIVAQNCKQKDNRIHYKRIPITPMLAPFLRGADELRFFAPARIRKRFKAILPDHKIYDMRTTFYSRCQECGVSDVARCLFMGHALGGLADTYTDVSDEYRIKEAQKIKY